MGEIKKELLKDEEFINEIYLSIKRKEREEFDKYIKSSADVTANDNNTKN